MKIIQYTGGNPTDIGVTDSRYDTVLKLRNGKSIRIQECQDKIFISNLGVEISIEQHYGNAGIALIPK